MYLLSKRDFIRGERDDNVDRSCGAAAEEFADGWKASKDVGLLWW